MKEKKILIFLLKYFEYDKKLIIQSIIFHQSAGLVHPVLLATSGKTAIYRAATAPGTGHVSEPLGSVSMAAFLGTRVIIAEMTALPTAGEVKVVQPPPSFVPMAAIQVTLDFSVTTL